MNEDLKRKKATERSRRWRIKNRERYNANQREWRKRNPEAAKLIHTKRKAKIKIYAAAYYQKNKEHLRVRNRLNQRKYCSLNREKINQKARERRLKHAKPRIKKEIIKKPKMEVFVMNEAKRADLYFAQKNASFA